MHDIGLTLALAMAAASSQAGHVGTSAVDPTRPSEDHISLATAFARSRSACPARASAKSLIFPASPTAREAADGCKRVQSYSRTASANFGIDSRVRLIGLCPLESMLERGRL